MADKSAIEWTDATWSVTSGCSLVSAGCENCYAMKFAHRFSGEGGRYEGLTVVGNHGPRWTGEVRLLPEHLAIPLRWKRPRRVFVNSMSDLFHEDVPDEYIAAVFGVMAACPQHTFQILTKRAERLPRWFRWIDEYGGAQRFIRANADKVRSLIDARGVRTEVISGRTVRSMDDAWMSVFNAAGASCWPLHNVWIGVSIEDQATADERIPHLLATPAAVRFVSAEPLLGPVDLFGRDEDGGFGPGWNLTAVKALTDYGTGVEHDVDAQIGIDWVIVGSESGPRARPMDVPWARSIVDQCLKDCVAVFVKQIATPEGRGAGERKGGNPAHWPAGEWPRQFPEVRA